ncbi:MAG: 5-formyltetrahydrofolate cyclo-ligase [Lachnospiraceae bacterium]|nr:5-formyltetrahydrofolate cyclo-ligase [Lachnospiraceae bacterium]
METAEQKQNLREEAAAILRQIPEKDRSAQSRTLMKMLTDSDLYVNSRSILVYVSTPEEPDTRELIKKALRDQKKVYVPKILGERMEFFRLQELSELKSGAMGIQEPVGNPAAVFPYSLHDSLESAQQCLVIIPGLAFDHSLGRLGRGKGYYDRFLSGFHKCMKIGYAFTGQILPEIPCTEQDVKMDLILTAEEVIH